MLSMVVKSNPFYIFSNYISRSYYVLLRLDYKYILPEGHMIVALLLL